MVKTRRQRRHERDAEEEKDRLSELPDCLLLHIMKFMDINYAVQTCILSKRWKDLWKRHTTLSLRNYNSIRAYNKILSQFVSRRDDSCSLYNLDFIMFRSTARKPFKNVIEYAALHKIQQLTIAIDSRLRNIPHYFVPLVFSCQSLTFLELSIGYSNFTLELPKSLMLPSLKTLFLKNVSFTSSGNVYAEPFSTCYSLNTLVLLDFTLRDDAEVLHISNSNISNLKLDTVTTRRPFQPKTVLSVPNLTSITILDNILFSYHELSSTCNLLLLEEVSIFRRYSTDPSIIISWLQVLSNVKILTLSSCTLSMIRRELENLATKQIQPPCFERLETLKIKLCPYSMISTDGVAKVVEYLLRNSPPTRVADGTRWRIIRNPECCSYRRYFID